MPQRCLLQRYSWATTDERKGHKVRHEETGAATDESPGEAARPGATTQRQDQRVLESLIAFTRAHNELGRRFARSEHVHTTDAAAIMQIIDAEDRDQPLTPARLAERIALSTGATSILLNRLEEAGHIVRTRESADRRIVTVHSTPSIHTAANAYYEPLARLLRAELSDYTAAELDLVETVVARVRSATTTYVQGPTSPPAHHAEAAHPAANPASQRPST